MRIRNPVELGTGFFKTTAGTAMGRKGTGEGLSLAPFLEQEPANLFSQDTQSKTDQELFLIIKNGGGLDMHGWADTFTDQQIDDLVQFIRSLP